MISRMYRMDNQSYCVQARLDKVEENVEVSPPASAKWQEMLAALEVKVLRAEKELSMYRKHVPSPILVAEVPPV